MNEAISDLLGVAYGGAPLAAITAAVYLVVLLGRRISPATWAKLPAWAQPGVPVALAGVGAGIEALRSGMQWADALALGVQAAIGAVGAHHVLKRVVPTVKPNATAVSASLVLLATGCGVLGGDPKTARDAYVDCVAERVEPELRELLAKAVSECPADGRCEALEAAALERLEAIATQCGAEVIAGQ